jgi:hypothetical protein
MTPKQAYSIDQKIDDGNPTLGNFLVDGFGGGRTLFSNAPTSSNCVYGVTNVWMSSTYSAGQGHYNTNPSTGGDIASCIPEFVMK